MNSARDEFPPREYSPTPAGDMEEGGKRYAKAPDFDLRAYYVILPNLEIR
jgi:hypothetical protein